MNNEEVREIRKTMDKMLKYQKIFVEQAPKIIPFKKPCCGVTIRMWNNVPGITIECDPGYCGIGGTLDSVQARMLGEALIEASKVSEGIKY